MAIHTGSIVERHQAHPTQMDRAYCACNMVASHHLLYRHLAPRAGLDVIVLHPLLKQTVALVWTHTEEAIVCFCLTGRADLDETRWTL